MKTALLHLWIWAFCICRVSVAAAAVNAQSAAIAPELTQLPRAFERWRSGDKSCCWKENFRRQELVGEGGREWATHHQWWWSRKRLEVFSITFATSQGKILQPSFCRRMSTVNSFVVSSLKFKFLYADRVSNLHINEASSLSAPRFGRL